MDCSAHAVRDMKKDLEYVVFFLRDVTEQQQIEESLQEHEKVLQSLIDKADDIMFQADPDGLVKFINTRVKVFGYQPNELKGKALTTIIPLRERNRFRMAFKKARQGKNVRGFATYQTKPNGKRIIVDIDMVPIKKRGQVIAVQGTIRDFSKHVQEVKKQEKYDRQITTYKRRMAAMERRLRAKK